jgi:hypothetical protein
MMKVQLIYCLLFFSLVCEVSYITPTHTQLSFRKFFKFQVLKPLDVKTKFYNAEVILESSALMHGQYVLVVCFFAGGTLTC